MLAAKAGADAVGLVFHEPSPRNVSIETAERIVAALPPFVTPVGLFVDARAGRVADVAGRLGLRHVQLHGHEGPEEVRAVGDAGRFVVLKAVRVDAGTFADELGRWRDGIARLGLQRLRGLVLETAAKGPDGAPGGTGLANDWSLIRQFHQDGAFDGLPPVVAAGGLTPETVGDVVRSIRPWAVDVSSGVERVKGQKCAEWVGAFVDAVRAADRGEG